MGLILAFGLALAVGRNEARRAAVVEDANAIGTTYLRAQLLAEPVRTRSLERLVRYTETSVRLSNSVPGSAAARRATADGQRLQRELWGLAGEEIAAAPNAADAASGLDDPAAGGSATRQPVNAGTPSFNHTVWMMSRPKRLAMLSRR